MTASHPSPARAAAALVALLVIVGIGCGTGDVSDADAPPSPPSSGIGSTIPADHDHSGDGLEGDHDISAVTVEEPELPHLVDDRVRAEAEALRRAVLDAARDQPWSDAEGARAAGYAPMPGDPLHWYDPEAVRTGGEVDPDHPEFLMIDGDEVLGVMFLAPSGDGTLDPPPAPGAPLVRWHLHRWSEPVCLGIGGLVVMGVPADDGTCPTDQVAATNSPWMFHVWLVGDDPFSAEMHLPGYGD